LNIADDVLGTAKSLADATKVLVESATTCQKERKASPQGAKYRNDPTWNNGLISAARAVCEAVTRLVQVSQEVSKGNMDEDALFVAAKMIAAATARLVTAARVRGNNSNAQRSLAEAARQVSAATSSFLLSAKRVGDHQDQEQNASGEDGGIGEYDGKVREFEELIKIRRLEKDLADARANLGQIRSRQYSR
jgi:hypothetical protein